MIIESLVGFGSGSLITGVVMLLSKIYQIRSEREERRDILISNRTKDTIKALDAVAYRTNNQWGYAARFILMLVPQLIMVSLIYIGFTSPDTVIWTAPDDGVVSPTSLNIFGMIEFEMPKDVTMQKFTGIVLLPIMNLQMGAVITYYLIGGATSRR